MVDFEDKYLDLIINKIKNERIAKGYSGEYMAMKLDISTASYHKLENKQTKISLRRLLKICTILEISPIEFFEENEILQKENEKLKNGNEKEYLELYKKNSEVIERLVHLLGKQS